MTARLRSRGFTLIELLIVVAIIGVLTTLLTANFIGVQQRGRDSKRKSDLRAIQGALELYKAENGHYPCTSTSAGFDDDPPFAYQTSGSTTSPWIRDDTSICPTNNPMTNYITNLPKDPINTFTTRSNPVTGVHTYGYQSSTCESGPGKYYYLVANLENSNDTETIGKTAQTVCGVDARTSGGWNANTIIYRNP